MKYHFDRCVLDTDAMRLVVDDVGVAIQPQVADVLALLIAERHRVVSKQELLERVWGHTFVTESTLTSRIKSARQAIGDDGQAQRLIRTVHGRGYQFVGDVREADHQSTSPNPTAPHRHLPTFGTRLIGRDTDIASVEALLDSARLVTIVGAGGVGKTRLAVEVAARRSMPCAFVDLSVIAEPSLVSGQVARALGIDPSAGDGMAAVVEYTANRPMLLVVDNIEHVIDAAVGLGALVRSASQVVILATSREPLRVEGEVVYALEPLTVPSAERSESASVLLFEEIARSADASFDLTTHISSVERICTAVDGLPLALELAASQVRALPPAMLLPRLSERLRSASGARRDAPDRQRTMADTIDWSVHLLTREELVGFTRMGVFGSMVTLELIEATIAGEPISDAIDVLGRLVDRSLVRRVNSDDGIDRFGMLTLLRERAAELLDASDESREVRARHAEVVATVLDDLQDRSWSNASSREQIAALLPEARSAFEFAAANGQWELAALITGALTLHRHRDGGHEEGRRWLDLVCPHLDELTGIARAAVLLALGFDGWHHDEQGRARLAWADAAQVFEELGDDLWLAYTLAFLSLTDNEVTGGNTERGAGHVERSVALARSVGRPALLATVLVIAGEFFRTIGDYTNARQLYEEAAGIAQSIDDRSVLSVALSNLAYVACHDGDFEAGRRLGRAGLEMSVAAGRRQFAAWSVSELAEPALGLGEAELGAQLVGAGERALAALGGRIYPGDLATHERVVAGLIAALGHERYQRGYERGASIDLDEAIRLALGDLRVDAL